MVGWYPRTAPATQLPDEVPSRAMTDALGGTTILVTGANTGIGRVTAVELARRGARVVLAGRSEERTRPVVDAIRAAGGDAEFLALDLGDLASVQRAAASWLDRGEPLHVLVNNAGLAGQRGTTKDGFELIFGTNHLGPFLFTLLLLPRLREAAAARGSARIVNVSSDSHYKAKGLDWDAVRRPTATVSGMPEYERSKLANVIFTKELARGHAGAGVHSYALHPGVVATDVWRGVPWPVRPIMKMFMISEEEGARTTLHCTTSPDVADHDGRYYAKEREKRPNPVAEDPAIGKELWSRSEELVAPFL